MCVLCAVEMVHRQVGCGKRSGRDGTEGVGNVASGPSALDSTYSAGAIRSAGITGGHRHLSRLSTSAQAGFSLLEVLVVLFIIGVAVTFATLSLGSDHRSRLLRVEAERLAHLIQIASQQAVMRSQQLGLDVSSDGYRFYILSQHKWTPLEGDDLLRERNLPAGFRLGLDLGAATPTLASSSTADSGGSESGTTARQPPILMLSSGEMVPFKLTLSEDGHPSDAYVVQGSFDGVVKVSSANAK